MKSLFNNGRSVAVTPGYICEDRGAEFVRKFHSIYIYSLKDRDCLDRIRKQETEGEWLSYLDRFVLLLPGEYQKKGRFWRDFYQYFGDDYLSFIDVAHNRACICEMLEYIKRHRKPGDTGMVLDYGCGSGISAEIEFPVKIAGYEPVKQMREQAVKNGLEILSKKQIEKLSVPVFDAVFASYVFHMAVDEKSIRRITEKMKPGSFWIANYYKGLNIENMNTIFTGCSFEIMRVWDFPERFGITYEYRRKSGCVSGK